MEIIFATANAHKVLEIQALCPNNIHLKSLKEIGITEEIPETAATIAGNSLQKAKFVFEQKRQAVFSEDTGLEVEALHGAPGVMTARYAGIHATFDDNMYQLLTALQNCTNRLARFVTIITFIEMDGKIHQFEGVCEGKILSAKTGNEGFGYDPIFSPNGSSKSFAEMTLEEKNQYSHRAQAFQKFVNFLKEKALV